MTTVNSLSGGRTSSYIAMNYPADHEVFSLVCNDDPRCAHPDKKVMQRVNDKLSKYSPQFGECIGSPENFRTMTVILDLEQMIGREIKWVRGESFDELARQKRALPNQNTRWCTTLMKMDPIFWYCYLRIGETVSMRVGFRIDEMERASSFRTDYKFRYSCKNYGQKQNSWKTVEWREGSFPLIEDRIDHFAIHQFWKDKGITFPKDSNCQMCFWKNEQQLRKNFEDAPHIMNWAKEIEETRGQRFKHGITMEKIEKIGLQSEFAFGTGSGCQAGFCTD